MNNVAWPNRLPRRRESLSESCTSRASDTGFGVCGASRSELYAFRSVLMYEYVPSGRRTGRIGTYWSAPLTAPAFEFCWPEVGVDLLRAWFSTVTETTAPNLLGNDNVSVASMWAKWLGPGPAASLLAVLTLLALVGLVILMLRQRKAARSPEYLEIATLMLLIPLISPQGWDYVLLLATPAVACIVDRWPDLTPPWRWTLGIALGVMGFTIFDVMGRALYGQFMRLAAVSVCALTIAAGLAHLRRRALA